MNSSEGTEATNWLEKVNGAWFYYFKGEDQDLWYYQEISESVLPPVDLCIYAISQSVPKEKGKNYYKGTVEIEFGITVELDYRLDYSGDTITKISYTCEDVPYLGATCEFVDYGSTKVENMPTINKMNLFKGVQSGNQFTVNLGNIDKFQGYYYCLFDVRNQIKPNYTLNFGDGFSKDLLQEINGITIFDCYEQYYDHEEEHMEKGFEWTSDNKGIIINKDLIKKGPLLIQINLGDNQSWNNATATLTGSD